MPSSFVDSVSPIVHMLIAEQPKTVLDVGPGWGKYGLMCREYLPDLERLDAVEVEEGLMLIQECIYDQMFVSDVRKLTSTFWAGEGRYDVVLLIDVIEHMGIEEGRQLLRDITRNGTKVLVSTPKIFEEQHDPNNPYETHVSHWTWKRFREFRIVADGSTIDSLIYLLA